MAKIHEQLTLQDQFSGPLESYIRKMERASTATQGSQANILKVSAATQALVDRLMPLQTAFEEAFTENAASKNINRLISQMERLGLVWTNADYEAHAADLILNDGLQELANQGAITANAVAQAAYEEASAKQAAKAAAVAEREAARQAAAEKRAAAKMEVQAAREAAAAEKAAAREQKLAANEAAKATESRIQKVKSLVSALTGLGRRNEFDGLNKQLNRFALSLFSVSRIVNAFKSYLERSPKAIQTSWSNAGTALSNLFGGAVVAALQGLQPHLDRLTAALNSDSGQRLARGLETLANVGGQALGFVLDKVSQLVTFLGDNFDSAVTVASVLLGVFAGRMLLSAAASAAANLPLYLMLGLLVSMVTGFMAAGTTAQDIMGSIGAAAGWLYALVYNLVADTWNVFATFAEFFANVFNDPVTAVAHLFFDTFDNILGVVETTAGAIDALVGSNLADAVAGFRSNLQSWVNDTFGENEIKIKRMDKVDPSGVMADFAAKGAGLADSLSKLSLDNALAAPLSPIAEDVNSIKKSVDLTDEDIKGLVDVATRKYVNNVNLTAQTPVITINGANTGNTERDCQAIADAVKKILLQEAAAGALRSTARVF